MAELLIKAKEPWQITDSGSRKGDIILVRPDGWKWGKCECLPDFIVVTVEGKANDLKDYESSLTEQTEVDGVTVVKTINYRKNYISTDSVDSVAEKVKDFEEITPVALNANIYQKVKP
jgi:uncharacterized protein YlzI (FlbEa/FlbD family)